MGNYSQSEKEENIKEEIKPNILNIYLCGCQKEIEKFENSMKFGTPLKSYERNYSRKHSKFNWLFKFYKEVFSESLINKIMNDIKKNSQNSYDINNDNCNVILIFFDFYVKNKLDFIIKTLEKTSKIYKPIVILASNNSIENVIKEKEISIQNNLNLDKIRNKNKDNLENDENNNKEKKEESLKINNSDNVNNKKNIKNNENKMNLEENNEEINNKENIIKTENKYVDKMEEIEETVKKEEKVDKMKNDKNDNTIDKIAQKNNNIIKVEKKYAEELKENKIKKENEKRMEIDNNIKEEKGNEKEIKKENEKSMEIDNNIKEEKGKKMNLVRNEKEMKDNTKMELEMEKKEENINKQSEDKKNEEKNNNEIKISDINKYMELIYYKDNDYSQIENKIKDLYCYFNNISDEYSIINEIINPTDEINQNKSHNYKAMINILVVGRAGGGKSTLINLLLNERKAREGIGESITKLYSKYIHSKYPISFIDTPGFETNKDFTKMIYYLEQSKNFFFEGKNKIHLALYIINSSNERSFISEEINLIKYIVEEMKLPLFFICTRSKNESYASDFKEVIKVNILQNFGQKTSLVNHIYCCHLLNEKDGIYKRFGINNILKEIEEYFKDYKTIFNINDPKSFEKYLNELSTKIIKNYKILIFQEEKKKKNKKNKLFTSNKKIRDLLLKHLASELDGNPIEFENNEIELDNENIGYNWSCNIGTEIDNFDIKEELIKDGNLKKIIKKTEEIGICAKYEYLKDIKKRGYHKFLEEIISDYEKAISSFSKISEDINKIIY